MNYFSMLLTYLLELYILYIFEQIPWNTGLFCYSGYEAFIQFFTDY